MFCADCGASSGTSTPSCERCGRPMVTPPLSQKARPTIQLFLGEQSPAAAGARHGAAPEPDRKSGPRILAAIAFVLLVAGVVVWFVSERGNSPEEIVAQLEQTYVEGMEQRDPALLREYFADPALAEMAAEDFPAGAKTSLVSVEVLVATDQKIIARVVNRVPSSDPDAAPGEYETVEDYYRYELVDTDDGEEWRFVTPDTEE